MPAEWVEVKELPKCDIPMCGKEAHYDGKTRQGPWGYLCDMHFKSMGVGLGVGRGQKLIVKEQK